MSLGLCVCFCLSFSLALSRCLAASLRWEHIKSKWAFYSFLFLLSLGVLNQALASLARR